MSSLPAPVEAPPRHLPVGARPELVTFDEMQRRAQVLCKAKGAIRPVYEDNPAAMVLVGMRGAELDFSWGYSLDNIDVIEGKPVPNAQACLTLLRKHQHHVRWVESSTERAIIKGRRKEYGNDPDAWVVVDYGIADAVRAELATLWVERWVTTENGKKYPQRYVVGDVMNGLDPARIEKAAAEAEADAEARKAEGNDKAKPNLWVKKEVDAGRIKSKDNWRKDPASMLRARAITNLCKMEFSDVLAGAGIEIAALEHNSERLESLAAEADVSFATGDLDDDPDDDIVDVELVHDDEPTDDTEDDVGDEDDEDVAAEPAAAQEHGGGGSSTATPSAPEEAVSGAPTEQDAPARPLAQQIAMQANEAGVERAHVISAVTGGEKTSAKAVTPDEGRRVLAAITEIRNGLVRVTETAAGEWSIEYIDAASPPEQPELEAIGTPPGDEDGWDANQWRGFLASRGVKVTELLREAHRLAKEDGVPGPASLDELAGRGAMCSLLRGFAEELYETRRDAS